MQLKWGATSFVENECDCKAHCVALLAGGKPYALRKTMQVFGRFYASGQADCTAAQIALQNALADPFRDLILLDDTGANSATLLTNAGSLGGVVITDGPNFKDNYGAEYATQRTFDFTATAEYPIASALALISFTETLSFSGGGPMKIFRPNKLGPFQQQIVYPQTTYKVVQRGQHVGYTTRIPPPDPIWPNDEHQDRRVIDEATPERTGNEFKAYMTSWTYHFESTVPLVGVPNFWPAGQ